MADVDIRVQPSTYIDQRSDQRRHSWESQWEDTMGFMRRTVMAFAAIAALTTGATAAGGGGGDGFGLGGPILNWGYGRPSVPRAAPNRHHGGDPRGHGFVREDGFWHDGRWYWGAPWWGVPIGVGGCWQATRAGWVWGC